MASKTKGRRPLTGTDIETGRAKILAAARSLFAQKGYRSVSMRAVAEVADMSAMSIYRYYENKRAILLHIWAEVFTQLFKDCRTAAAQAREPADAVKAYAIFFVDYWVSNPENYLMIYGEIDTPVGGESFFADSEEVATELAYIAGLIAASGTPESEVELTLQQLICAMHGVCHSLITIPELRWRPSDTLIAGLVEALLRH